MQVTIIAEKDDHKLNAGAYSQTYYDMFKAFIKECYTRFKEEPYVVFGDCDADELDGSDVIIFWDLHSSHSIHVKGVKQHPALKIEMLNDPHQTDFIGKYRDGKKVHKLGRKERVKRAYDRGVSAVWCPYFDGFTRCLGLDAAEAGLNLWWFPVAPSIDRFKNRFVPLAERLHEVLGNGAVHASGMNCYDFRRWAFNRLSVTTVPHCLVNCDTPKGTLYGDLLSSYAGAMGLCDWYPVPKYFEIPLAGCVPFMQYLPELDRLGFVDGVNCILVDESNFDERINAFLDGEVENYQKIADNGRKLIELNYTSAHFAGWFLDNIERCVNDSSKF